MRKLAAIVLVALLGSCSPARRERDLCADLRKLSPTFDLLVHPDPRATVRVLREGLIKVEPLVDELADYPSIDVDLRDTLWSSHVAYRAELKGISDDDQVNLVLSSITVPAARLDAALGDVANSVSCERPGDG
jgi:hypothetical protein